MDRTWRRVGWTLLLLLLPTVGCAPVTPRYRGDSGTPPPREDGAIVSGCEDGLDSDGDGIADQREGTGDPDGDGVPSFMDDDSDGDGISDAEEAGTSGNPCSPQDSDLDGTPDFVDTDSDNDGLTDAEEIAAGSNPHVADSDGDGVDDLTETVAGSDPNDPASGPPPGSLYVVIPYHPPGEVGERPLREFEFQTRVKAADVFFVVDTTGSMSGTVTSVQNNLASTIIPGIDAAIGPDGDARYGVAAHGDFAEGGPNDYSGALTIFSNLTADADAAARSTSSLRAEFGGDEPESQVAALFGLIEGRAFPAYNSGAGTYPTTSPAHPMAPKTPTRQVDPRNDCPGIGPDDPIPYGWGCFVEGRLPVLVLMSDATMHNGMGSRNDYGSVPGAPTYDQLRDEILRREAIFVGVSVGGQRGTGQYTQLATDTNSFRGDGTTPLVFSGDQSETANLVRDALVEIIGQSRQNITTRVDPDLTETRLPTGRTTNEFITAVRPNRGIPDAPTGYDNHDETTFYNVAPSTRVVFEAEFYNDFQPGSTSAQVFQATIVVLGRAGTEVDERQVFMVVPADGAQIIF